MNSVFENEFGYREPMLPLKASGNIVNANSLRIEWDDVCPKEDENGDLEVYVCGNPPFLGSGGRSEAQNADMEFVFRGFDFFGMLDFVTCWFWKASMYIHNNMAQFAFVSTNSISQGEQIGQLWPNILNLNLKIKFAHKTFSWTNHAKDKAAVHVVIIGICNEGMAKQQTLYSTTDGDIASFSVNNISPYLISGKEVVVRSRSKPISDVSPMLFGNKPVDSGFLMLSRDEKDLLIASEPDSEKYVRRLLGADEFLNGKERYCIWLVNATSEQINGISVIRDRVESVRQFRLASKKAATRKKASIAHLFDENRQPSNGEYLLIPRVSSERRPYLPIGFFDVNVISSDANQIIPNATLFEFAVLNSELHNDWMRIVAGRLKSDYRYSATLVYNTFPWPDANPSQKGALTKLAQEILLIREDHPEKTLAQMYNPETMPENLRKAHQTNDRAVEKLYRGKPFENTSERIEFLFKRYEQLIAEEANNA